ncbi:MAG: hypothetical protein DMG39_10385 [Acidobacteria bacterium]|nr:MAG: hypothetical protein DMG39_10385 [Acidobacteriota bacterium]
MTSSEKGASPIDAIFPDCDRVSGYGTRRAGTIRSGIGVAQEAKVKHTIKIEAKLSAVRNGIETLLFDLDWDGENGTH